MLSWLPWWERQALARMSELFAAPAGTHLLREGAPALDVFVVEEGRAAVIRDGRRIAKLGRKFAHVLHRLPRLAGAMRALASQRLLGSNLGVALN